MVSLFKYHILISTFLMINSDICAQISRTNIVLIFHDIPAYERSSVPFPKVKFIDDRPQLTVFDNFVKYDFNPKPLKTDTISFAPSGDEIAIRFLYKSSYEPIHYIIGKGDTVSFNFKNGVPYAKSKLNIDENTLNYEYSRLTSNKKIQQPSPLDIYMNPHLDIKKIEDDIFGMETKTKWYFSAINYLNQEIDFLSDFKKNKQIDSKTIDFLFDKLTFQIDLINFEQHKFKLNELSKILSLQREKISGVPYSYFYSLVQAISDSVNVRKSKIISYKNGKEPDYREVYDRTKEWKEVNDFYKKHLLYSYLIKIGNIFPVSDLRIYLTKFSASYKDTLLSNRIKREFPALEMRVSRKTDSLHLASLKNVQFTLEKVLDENKGKVIYVDFWASWCGPCREAMPASRTLRNQLRNKEIIFIYLSIDDNVKAWQKAVEKEELIDYLYNYLVTNHQTAQFFKEQKITEIPRYLIFDKFGQLLYPNAPSVESNEIELVLTKLADRQYK